MLLGKESKLSKLIAKSDSFEELELLISQLTEKIQNKRSIRKYDSTTARG